MTAPPERGNAPDQVALTEALKANNHDTDDSTPAQKSVNAYGATPDEWSHFDLLLELTADLLPVVSNPGAQISPESKMKALGKTPSRYNGAGKVAGIANWTTHKATFSEVTKWSKQPDYGICIQTRTVRALDIDIDNPVDSEAVLQHIRDALGCLPVRERANSGKKLVAFTLAGDFAKRTLRTAGGMVEFLAEGQQFVACGTHPSGARYEWLGGLPVEFPVVAADAFEALWGSLVTRFAIEPPTERKTSTKAVRIEAAVMNDPTAQALHDRGLVLGTKRDGGLHIRCPFSDEHTTGFSVGETTYFPAHTGGYERGHFYCQHAHCQGRADQDFLSELGIDPTADDFKDETAAVAAAPLRYQFLQAGAFAAGKPPKWLVRDVLPDADLVVIYGESQSGKSFFAMDMVVCIALGVNWRDKRVSQGRVAYVAAEGAGGVRNRLKAQAEHRNFDIDAIDLYILGDAPNFMERSRIADVIASLKACGPVSVVVVDTLAQVMPGGNENGGEDMGKVLGHCKDIRRATGALVVLIHHSGKDASKGARGWSGLRAAADAEIEVLRADNDRVATITKLKDGEDGAEFGFRLHQLPVGTDDAGEIVTSCVIEATTAAKHVKRSGRGGKLGSNEEAVLGALRDLLDLGGGKPTEIELVTEAAKLLTVKPGRRDTRRVDAARAVASLKRKKRFEVVDGKVGLSGC